MYADDRMRRLLVFNIMSLDGIMAGPNGELDWFTKDLFRDGTGVDDLIRENLNSVGAILLGRLTYQELGGYWPGATNSDPVITERMNALPKIVFSKTLGKVEWGKWNTARLAKGDPAEEVRRLKEESGKDLVIYGSGQLVSALMKERLVDEFQFFIQPIVLGRGTPEFKGLKERYWLRLLESKPLTQGALFVRYQPAEGPSAV